MIRITSKLRTALNLPRVKKAIGDGRDRALDKAGSMIRRSAQKQISRRSPKKKPIWKAVGTHEGMPLVSLTFQDSKPGKVTSWKPKEFLYRKIFYDKDKRRESVVIGPDQKVAKVQQLHEFGGSDAVKLKLIAPQPVANLYQYKVPNNLLGGGRRRGRRAYVGMWHSGRSRAKGKTVATAAGRVPAAKFMEKGLDAKRRDIPAMFRNAIRGP